MALGRRRFGGILLITAASNLSVVASGHHIGVRSVASFRQFSMPPAVFIFIFDVSSVTGDVLFGGDQLGGCQGRGLGAKRLREYIVELICPASVVSDDSVMDFDHDGASLPSLEAADLALECAFVNRHPHGAVWLLLALGSG
jgi:hypothetical protein